MRERGKKFSIDSVAIAVALFFWVASGLVWTPSAGAVLAQGDAVTDPAAILRNALPIENKPVRKLQESIEDIAKNVRGKRWSSVKKDVKDANYVLATKSTAILESVPDDRKAQGEALIEQLKTSIAQLDTATEAKDKETIATTRREILNKITDLEELMVVGFPFEVPSDYANLPQLKGRATVEIKTTKGDMTVVVDGYNAPVNAGNFVDLVRRGFYNG